MSEYLLETVNLSKYFSGVAALKEINFKVKKGEIHALVGENGAGKSTLIHILVGALRPDAGSILLDGKTVSFNSPIEATNMGIAAVFQELSVVNNLSVAENIFSNRQPIAHLNAINFKKLYEDARKMLQLFDIDYIDPRTPVGDLSVANRQLIEILKAMSYNPQILILDEPTSSLTDIEIKNLFKNIRRLKELGVTFIYISHHLQEIFEIADSLTVFRDGTHICDAMVSEVDENFLVSKMVGRQIQDIYGSRTCEPGDMRVKVDHISRKGSFSDVSFNICKGEIVGFSGLVGAGRTEVARALFGAEPIESGEIRIDGQAVRVQNPSDAIRNGIGYVTEDRKQLGLFLNHAIKANLVSNKLGRVTKRVAIVESRIGELAKKAFERFKIVATGIDQLVVSLSGGNQQKVLLAEWFDLQPKLLIIDEPTRGVDVGARSDIYERIRELAKEGTAIMLISSDLPEVIGLSDRVMVMRNGMVVGEISREEATEESVLSCAVGVSAQQ